MTKATNGVTGNLKLDIENLRAEVDMQETGEVSVGERCRCFVAKHGGEGVKAYLADILNGQKFAEMPAERQTYYKRHQQRLNRATKQVARETAIAGLSKAQVKALDDKAEKAKAKAAAKRKADAKAKVIESVASSPKAVIKLAEVQVVALQQKEKAPFDIPRAIAAWQALAAVYAK